MFEWIGRHWGELVFLVFAIMYYASLVQDLNKLRRHVEMLQERLDKHLPP